MEFSYKLFEQGSDKLLAIADKDILGKTFSSGNINIEISKEFYHQEFCDEEKLMELIKKATIINAMGKQIIEFLVKHKMIKRTNVKKPAGVPHAQVYTIND